ncbi:hypothetical protein [Actinomadura litoris]|uniref:hypothetical protein n=1 Tax=Actinomadura litoris TaxID=2678616 RepID=UPI001FA72011|nr:hypothetical protein [Actinomadura litoris]
MTEQPAVLVLTSLEDVTADLVIAALGDRGVPTVRVDPADIDPATGGELCFAARLGAGEDRWSGPVRTPSRSVDLGRVRSVYHRRPSPWRFDHLAAPVRDFARREAQHGLAGVLFHLPVLHVNAPWAVARAEFKPAQLQVAADLGFTIPATLITNDPDAARGFAAEHAPVVYKSLRGVPPADGHAGAIWTQRIDPADLDESVQVTAHLFQAEVDKAADARVTVVGRQVSAWLIEAPGTPLDWRSGDFEALEYSPLKLPEQTIQRLYAYLDHFALAYGCFDFAVHRPTGELTWIECNAAGQWGFLPDSDGIADAFAALLQAG